MRSLYQSVGLDTAAEKDLGAEADALFASLIADVANPTTMGIRAGISLGGPLPVLARRGSLVGRGGIPVIPVRGVLMPLWAALLGVLGLVYWALLVRALRVQEPVKSASIG